MQLSTHEFREQSTFHSSVPYDTFRAIGTRQGICCQHEYTHPREECCSCLLFRGGTGGFRFSASLTAQCYIRPIVLRQHGHTLRCTGWHWHAHEAIGCDASIQSSKTSTGRATLEPKCVVIHMHKGTQMHTETWLHWHQKSSRANWCLNISRTFFSLNHVNRMIREKRLKELLFMRFNWVVLSCVWIELCNTISKPLIPEHG